jgi:MFS family permease
MSETVMAEPKEKKVKVRINWKYVLIFGFWEASLSVIWGVYNNYMPVFWQSGNPNYNVLGASAALGFGLGAFTTSIIMSVDNIGSVIMQPIFGALSDRVKSRKRIVVWAGAATAILYAMLPIGFLSITPESSGDLAALTFPFVITILIAFLMILFWGIAKPSEMGLRYAIIPTAARSRVYGLIAFVVGIAFVLTFTTSNILYNIFPALPFWIGAGFLLITVILYMLFVKEPEGTTLAEDDSQVRSFRDLFKGFKLFNREQLVAIVLISATKFLSWFGVAGLETFASSYLVNVLGMNESAAGNMTAIYFLGYLAACIPSGYLSNKIGRRRLWAIALFAFIFTGVVQYLTHSATLIFPVLIIAGMANAITDVMALPMVTDVAPSKKVMGISVALLASITTLASIFAVPMYGAIFELTNNNFKLLWLGMAIAPVLALIVLSRLKKGVGEAKAATTQEEAEW